METWLLVAIAAVLVVIFIVVSLRSMGRGSEKPGPASPPDEMYPAKQDFEAQRRGQGNGGSTAGNESEHAPTSEHDRSATRES